MTRAGVQATNAAVAFEAVSKTFGQVMAVNKLNLQVAQGAPMREFLAKASHRFLFDGQVV